MVMRVPFGGQPVLPRPSSANEAKRVFVLGAYPSGLHVAWWIPGHEQRTVPDAKALIVDNEPEVFWDGAAADAHFTSWKNAVGFDQHPWGRVELPGQGGNGPSGKWLADSILKPLGLTRADCWITDCLDTARLNPDQKTRIEKTYEPLMEPLGLPNPQMQQTPKGESGIVAEARAGHLDRMKSELDKARPELIITLGNAALRVLRELVTTHDLDVPRSLTAETYGVKLSVVVKDRPVSWLPLVHPRSGERTPKWHDIHAQWIATRPIST